MGSGDKELDSTIAAERLRKERLRKATEPFAGPTYPKPAPKPSIAEAAVSKLRDYTTPAFQKTIDALKPKIAERQAQNRGARELNRRMPRKSG